MTQPSCSCYFAVVSHVTLYVRRALVRATTSASHALFQSFLLAQHVLPNVQLECSTARLLILASSVTQIVNHAAGHLQVTATLVKVFIFKHSA